MKNLKNLGTILKKEELKNINGSFGGKVCMAPYCLNEYGRCEYQGAGGYCDNDDFSFVWNW
ncbi:hypothetical protein [Winogradskyella sp. PE311]|uniref:hypothetical protein n=1 Tax=Winogradskyella sp. PE311 TaxID=3366943 RepID=UPI00397EB88A